MPTVSSGPLSFSNIRDNFVNYINSDGFNYGSNNANLYNLNYYRGKRYWRAGVDSIFPTGSIAFNIFYNSDGNCACLCTTDSSCFPGDAIITMADGTFKRIDQIKVGDIVDGGFGYRNRVEAYHTVNIGTGHVYIINGKHRTTIEHKHWTTEGWAAIDTTAAINRTALTVTVDNDGTKAKRSNTKLSRTKTNRLKVGMTLLTATGLELIESIERDRTITPDTIVYTLVTDGSHSHICNGYIVGGWARDFDFDYDTWTPLERIYDDSNSTASPSNTRGERARELETA